MQKRILREDGKLVPYVGGFTKATVKSPEQKMAERVVLEDKAKQGGFKSDNPVVGGLTDEDKDLIRGGMKLVDMLNLAITRKMVLPNTLETKDEFTSFLLNEKKEEEGEEKEASSSISADDKEKILAGVSIPEMRKMAKDAGMEIPKEARKAVDIKKFLLGEEEDLGL